MTTATNHKLPSSMGEMLVDPALEPYGGMESESASPCANLVLAHDLLMQLPSDFLPSRDDDPPQPREGV